jgi:hypothetical protein
MQSQHRPLGGDLVAMIKVVQKWTDVAPVDQVQILHRSRDLHGGLRGGRRLHDNGNARQLRIAPKVNTRRGYQSGRGNGKAEPGQSPSPRVN